MLKELQGLTKMNQVYQNVEKKKFVPKLSVNIYNYRNIRKRSCAIN